MKEIIEHGYKQYKGECFTCGCKFTYELEDIIGYNVICPDCGAEVSHYPDDHTRNSQLTDNNNTKNP